MWCLRFIFFLPFFAFPPSDYPVFQLSYLVSLIACYKPCLYCTTLVILLFCATCALPTPLSTAPASLAASSRCWLSFGRHQLCALRFAPAPTSGHTLPLPSPKRLLASARNVTAAAEAPVLALWGRRLLEAVPNPLPRSVAVPKVAGAQVRIAWGFW